MAVLSDTERRTVWQEYQRELSDKRESVGTITKVDLRAAVNALDDFFEANAAAINSAIPQPARAQLSISQKARLAVYVLTRRYIIGA